MSRSKKGKKPVGWDYWGKRPIGGGANGTENKRVGIQKERAKGKREVKSLPVEEDFHPAEIDVDDDFDAQLFEDDDEELPTDPDEEDEGDLDLDDPTEEE